MSSSSIKKEERDSRGSDRRRGGAGRHTDRHYSPSRSSSHVVRDETIKHEEKVKREHSTTYDDHNHYPHSKRPKTEPPSTSSTSPTSPHPPPPPPPAIVKKESINLGLSGKLAAHANTTTGGTILKYQPPADAALPTLSYRLYCFPTSSAASSASAPQSPHPPLYIHSQSLYRVGREPTINDLIIDHHSVSKQHAVLQYRQPPRSGGQVKLYVLDVGSVNGTCLNGVRLEEARYVELRERDVLVFGRSGREYVLLHGDSRAETAGTGEQKEGSGGTKEEKVGGRKRPAWADDDDDDV